MNDEWEEQAQCLGTDPDLFFEAENAADALRVCARCPVVDECLAYQLEWEHREGYFTKFTQETKGRRLMAGVFGGMTVDMRWTFVHNGLDNELHRVFDDESVDPVWLLGEARKLWEKT